MIQIRNALFYYFHLQLKSKNEAIWIKSKLLKSLI